MAEIANNCKISEITIYGEKITKIDNNVKKNAKDEPKTAKNGQIKKKLKNVIVFVSKLPQKIDTVG